ncbi:Uncharacterised protein [Edwardsiella tarda]|nr:Uncharacterised protein [Edwardsiella tarda]
MRLLFLLLFIPFFLSAEPLTRSFTPFKMSDADKACIARPSLNLTVSGAWRSNGSWWVIMDGCIYEARGIIVGNEHEMAAEWFPRAAYDPTSDGGEDDGDSGGGGGDSGGSGGGNGSGKVSGVQLLALANSLRDKECNDNPTLVCGTFSPYYEPREVMLLSEISFHAEYYLCEMNGSTWRSLYKSTCYLRTGYKIEDGKIIPDNHGGGDGGGSNDGNNDNGGNDNNDNGGNGGNGGNDNNDNSGNGGEGSGSEWTEKIYNLLNYALYDLGGKIDGFHSSFIVRAETTNNYLADIDSKLGQLTEVDDDYLLSQHQFNGTLQGVIEGGIQSYEQEVKNKTGELISQLEQYVPILNVSHILPSGFFGYNRDTCIPLDFSFALKPFGGNDFNFSLSTKEVCRFYDGYLREMVRFFIYVLTGVSLIVLIDKSVSRL